MSGVDTVLSRNQTFSHYPAIPPAVRVRLHLMEPHDCSYLPGRVAQVRGALVGEADGAAWETLLETGFRRSGRMIYQPVCVGCRKCVSLRVKVAEFRPSESQRRTVRRNADLRVEISEPQLTDEKVDLYRSYLSGQHHRPANELTRDISSDIESFLYSSPVPCVEMAYRDKSGVLLGVGIIDVVPNSVSSVYFYWNPEASHRSLGIYSMLRELELAAETRRDWYYLGYWVAGSPTMDYKAKIANHQLLGTDGVWRDACRKK